MVELAAETDAETSSCKAVILVDVVVARVIGEGMSGVTPLMTTVLNFFYVTF